MQAILQGLQIIARIDPRASISAEHDQIWCGSSELDLTPSERNELADLGWFVDKANRSWTRFT